MRQYLEEQKKSAQIEAIKKYQDDGENYHIVIPSNQHYTQYLDAIKKYMEFIRKNTKMLTMDTCEIAEQKKAIQDAFFNSYILNQNKYDAFLSSVSNQNNKMLSQFHHSEDIILAMHNLSDGVWYRINEENPKTDCTPLQGMLIDYVRDPGTERASMLSALLLIGADITQITDEKNIFLRQNLQILKTDNISKKTCVFYLKFGAFLCYCKNHQHQEQDALKHLSNAIEIIHSAIPLEKGAVKIDNPIPLLAQCKLTNISKPEYSLTFLSLICRPEFQFFLGCDIVRFGAQKLIDSGNCNLEIQSSIDGATPLVHAASYGDPELVKLLLDNGAKVPHSAIQHAEFNCNGEVVQLLKDHMEQSAENTVVKGRAA